MKLLIIIFIHQRRHISLVITALEGKISFSWDVPVPSNGSDEKCETPLLPLHCIFKGALFHFGVVWWFGESNFKETTEVFRENRRKVQWFYAIVEKLSGFWITFPLAEDDGIPCKQTVYLGSIYVNRVWRFRYADKRWNKNFISASTGMIVADFIALERLDAQFVLYFPHSLHFITLCRHIVF